MLSKIMIKESRLESTVKLTFVIKAYGLIFSTYTKSLPKVVLHLLIPPVDHIYIASSS